MFLCEKSTATDLGSLQSKLLSLTEAVASAEKAGDVERLAMLSSQWKDISPVITKDLGDLFDQSEGRLSADIKKYRAKSEDGSLPEKTSQSYQRLAVRMQESLKNLIILKNQTKMVSEKLNKSMTTIAERPDVKSLIEAHEAHKKASESLQKANETLEKLSNLQR